MMFLMILRFEFEGTMINQGQFIGCQIQEVNVEFLMKHIFKCQLLVKISLGIPLKWLLFISLLFLLSIRLLPAHRR